MSDPPLRPAGRKIFATTAGRILYLLVGAGILAAFGFNSLAVYVGPNQYGIKQVTYGVGKGIDSEIYTAGLHYLNPVTEHMFLFPTDIQVLAMTNDANEKPREGDGRAAAALNIQTSEGYNVTVDVSVLYRIEDPYKVMTKLGPGRLYETSLVVPRAEQILRKRLGELNAEDFYNAEKRVEKAALALTDLNTEMNPSGVRALHVLVRQYVYDDRYQQAIEQRKIQDQTVFKNQAEAEMATANAEKDRIVAEGQARVKVELARGDGEKAKIDAQAELYERTQRAAGEKELKLAEAEGTRLEAEALKGSGSEYLVGLKMADALKGTRVIIVPTDGDQGTNPLDLKSALKRFDVGEGK